MPPTKQKKKRVLPRIGRRWFPFLSGSGGSSAPTAPMPESSPALFYIPWEEDEHPRGVDGKFLTKGNKGGGSGNTPEAKEKVQSQLKDYAEAMDLPDKVVKKFIKAALRHVANGYDIKDVLHAAEAHLAHGHSSERIKSQMKEFYPDIDKVPEGSKVWKEEGKHTPPDSTSGKLYPRNYEVRNKGDEYGTEAAHEEINNLMGKYLSTDEVGAMVGMPHGSEIKMSVGWGDEIEVHGRLLDDEGQWQGTMKRIISMDDSGEVTCHNEKFVLADNAPEGMGTRIFAKQVAECHAQGIRHISTFAARNPDEGYVGYYVWARLGYDGHLKPEHINSLPRSLEGSKRVSDLMRTPEGRQWWKKNGDSIEMEFDTDPDSMSSQVLKAYLEAKEIRTHENSPWHDA